ncbi:response regulator transcription factor [uncultured Bacteroides sp.]|uniref:response regulator transcription factor n=1 Tax=uncultured Bacteroides sp. TaxID=162156 RepID=UPI002AAA875C|nr:response regulator transcription factor [uncultured Bacteroides sp.]
MDMNAAILIYGPDCNSTRLLQESFRNENLEVKLCSDVDSAYGYYCDKRPQVCILHEFPSQDSCFPLARRILAFCRDSYLIFIFKQDKMVNFRIGYQLGADDCLMVPYDTDELKLRLKAMIRRGYNTKTKSSNQYVLGKYLFDAQKGFLYFNQSKIHLTTREADLLSLLCKRMNEFVSKDDALKMIWSAEEFANSRVLSIYIFKLRQIFKNDLSVQIITQHGTGYKLTSNSINRIADVVPFKYNWL